MASSSKAFSCVSEKSEISCGREREKLALETFAHYVRKELS